MKMNKLIDHTLLKPDATASEIDVLCREAVEHGFYSVCVNPYYVSRASGLVKDSDVKVACVVGFPLGASLSEVKAFEAGCAVRDGADEIDMVMNISALKNGEHGVVESDIKAVVAAAKPDAIVKVIIETCLLSDGEKEAACAIAKRAGAHFVKTSTGFSTGGATVEDVTLMRRIVGDVMGVKASGGIRTAADLKRMVEAGATRIGASASVSIVKGKASTGGY